MKAHLRVTIDDDDLLIMDKIATATEWVLKYTAISSEATVPGPVNEAIRQIAAHLYANREASLVGVTAQSLPFGTLDLLAPYTPFVCG
ncbi:head-tail connector protein [Rhodopseudomonas palustris]|nr:head-tail connector protein [Rhodopseudomonas palustris]